MLFSMTTEKLKNNYEFVFVYKYKVTYHMRVLQVTLPDI